ncbi:alpha/beta hydrolase [Metabacillus litoralis]|uniref:alpha/beta hydrolase n=1 Tax=Metabacillus litoralis TaxID=152268 RepID=UPI001CFF0BA4|nr:alpha/beta hydrolase [Metabacillus litoralis]
MLSIKEELFSVEKDITLRGTLAIPQSDQERFPAIILINGSGSADRDGNMKKPKLITNLYKELAHFLTNLGFLTLRYDKRSVGESEGDPFSSGMEDLVTDVKSMVTFLKQHPKVKEKDIILLGHSEGCILATKVSEEVEEIAGLILLGGAGTNLAEPMNYQNQLILEEIQRMKGLKGKLLRRLVTKEKINKQIEQLNKKLEQSSGDFIRMSFKKMPAKWFREHFAYKSEQIVKALERANCPILAITGDKDVQMDVVELSRMQQLDKNDVTVVAIKNMDHMLKEYKGEKSVLNIMKQYKKQATDPIHSQLKGELSTWLQDNYLHVNE